MKFNPSTDYSADVFSRITREAKDKLKAIASEQGVSVSEVVRAFIDYGIEAYDIDKAVSKHARRKPSRD